MIFSDPRWLAALWVVPVALALVFWLDRRARGALRRLVGERSDVSLLAQVRPRGRMWTGGLRALAIGLLVVGAARPEWGREVVRRAATGSDVVLVVDVSASMDVRDVAPSRLHEARREAAAVLERLGGSRVGVVAFAGDAVRLCPLTLDRAAARLTLESLSSYSVSAPGSDLGRGLRLAARMLPAGRREEQAIVVWTDGEDLEAGAHEAADELAESGVRVFAVGVGTPAGDVVPVLDEQGRVVDIKREEGGAPHRSRLDIEVLRHVARRTRGAVFAASRPGGELPRLLAALGALSRSARGERLVERPVARFMWFAAAALLLLAIERVGFRRRREVANRLEPPADAAPATRRMAAGRAAAAAIAVALLVPGETHAQSDWARGDRAYRSGRFAEADSLYTRRLSRKEHPSVRLNRATSRALAPKPEGRARGLEELDGLAGRTDAVGPWAGYNLGTLLGEDGELERGLATLRRALERNPADEDARWNYEVLRQRQERQRQQEPPPSPRPQQPQPQPQGSPPPTPPPSQGTPQPDVAPPSPAPRPIQGMSREQAEQILDALQEMQRMEQQRQRRVRVLQEKRGRDW